MLASGPKWLLPWLFPLVLLAGLVTAAVSFWLGLVVLFALVGVLVRLRLANLRDNPPEPELQRRNFWDFR
jgi:hypothetical protein